MEDEEDNGDFIERLARQLREKPVSTFIPASLRRSCDDSTTTGDSTNADSSPNCFYHPTNNLKENTATSFTKKPLVEIDSSGNPIPYPSSNEVHEVVKSGSDNVSRLNTLCHRMPFHMKSLPIYKYIRPSEDDVISVHKWELKVGEISVIGTGEGKKEAKQKAASTLLQSLVQMKSKPRSPFLEKLREILIAEHGMTANKPQKSMTPKDLLENTETCSRANQPTMHSSSRLKTKNGTPEILALHCNRPWQLISLHPNTPEKPEYSSVAKAGYASNRALGNSQGHGQEHVHSHPHGHAPAHATDHATDHAQGFPRVHGRGYAGGPTGRHVPRDAPQPLLERPQGRSQSSERLFSGRGRGLAQGNFGRSISKNIRDHKPTQASDTYSVTTSAPAQSFLNTPLKALENGPERGSEHVPGSAMEIIDLSSDEDGFYVEPVEMLVGKRSPVEGISPVPSVYESMESDAFSPCVQPAPNLESPKSLDDEEVSKPVGLTRKILNSSPSDEEVGTNGLTHSETIHASASPICRAKQSLSSKPQSTARKGTKSSYAKSAKRVRSMLAVPENQVHDEVPGQRAVEAVDSGTSYSGVGVAALRGEEPMQESTTAIDPCRYCRNPLSILNMTFNCVTGDITVDCRHCQYVQVIKKGLVLPLTK